MSRLFGSGEVIKATAFQLPTKGAMSMWVYSTVNQYDNVDRIYFEIMQDSPLCIFHLEKYTDNKVYWGWYNNGTDKRIATADNFIAQNDWTQLLLVWENGGSTVAKYNGNGSLTGGSVTGTVTWDTSAEAFNIGNNKAVNRPISGRICEVAIWNDWISEPESLAIYNGWSPLFIRPANLIHYWPIFGNNSPEWNCKSSKTLALTGTSQAVHTRVMYPPPPFIQSEGVTPVFNPAWARSRSIIIQPGII